jgi:GH24 family phage-related lysozyme (muramidase)
VADDELVARLAAVPDLFPPLTAAGVTFIARLEVTGAAAYRQKYKVPTWPSEESGITIGIGYDCQFVKPAQFRLDWSAVLPADVVERLVPVLGVVGSQERLTSVSSVVVPLPAAVTVFATSSLRRCLDDTRRIYPQVDTLDPSRRTALLSLVYNRGTRLTDKEPREERREMRAIQELLSANRLDEIPTQFESMTRLWDPAKLAGLIDRRRTEATLWRSGFAVLQLE